MVLVNAEHMKAVPGRTTDGTDADWIADLVRHGLLKASFIPPAPLRARREPTRDRKSPIHERTREADRPHQVPETATIEPATVATEILGKSGRLMRAAPLGGETDPEALSELARGRLRQKLPERRRARAGRVQPHHLVLIERILARIDFLHAAIAHRQEEIDRCLVPFREAVGLLQTIPGVSAQAAAAIVAAIGTAMSRFPSATHVASRAGVCPGNRERAGKRQRGKPTGGDTWLKAVLGEVAWASARTKDNSLAARCHRLARRRGKLKAVVAVAQSVLVIADHLLRDKQPYRELGGDDCDRLNTAGIKRHLVGRLRALGDDVALTPALAAQ